MADETRPVIERMQKAAVGIANEEEDAMLAGIKRIMELEAALQSCVALAAAHVGSYMVSHGLKDYHPAHKDIINRAQRLLGGRELH